MIFDTDVLIWIQRGSVNAAKIFDATFERSIAVQTYMELLQGAENLVQQMRTRKFLKEFNVQVLPMTEEIGNRAMSLVEQYSLSHSMRSGDALIAATALAYGVPLCTANAKHYRPVPLLELKTFRP